MIWSATVLTILPEMFPRPLGHSLAGRALADGRWRLAVNDIRAHATDRHRSVDDTPAGGGPGMVMRVDVLAAAVDAARAAAPAGVPVLALSPRGRPLTQARVRALAAGPGAVLVCGRFEGFDERLFEARDVEPVSVGDYVLSGGELGAMVLIDACVRLLPGTMGAGTSADEESFENGLLEYPQYTRPARFEGLDIPAVLREGNHSRIAQWRAARARADTLARRPDLIASASAPSGADPK